MQQLLKDMMGSDKKTSYNNGNSNNTSTSAKAISSHLNKTDNHLQQHLQ